MKPSRWNNRLKAVAIGLGLALTALTIRHWYGTFLYGHPPCEDCRADFPSIYSGARLIWQSPSALYDEASQLAIQRTIDPRIGDSTLPFTYPPFVAAVLMPLGRLSFPLAFVAITLINATLLVMAIRLLIERLQLSHEQSLWLVLTSLCSFGVHSALLQGQASFILSMLLLLFTLAVQENRPVGAGVFTGLIFFKPQLQAVPSIILLMRRKWLALMLAAATVVALVLVSWLLVGSSGIVQYVDLLTGYLTKKEGHGSYPESMQNLRAVAQYAAPFQWVPYLWLALVLPIAVLTFSLNARLCTDPKANAVQWIGNFAASVLIAPHFNGHDLAILMIPTAFALKLYGDPVPPRLILLLLGIGIYPLFALVMGDRAPPMVPVVIMIIFFWSVWSVRRSFARASENR